LARLRCTKSVPDQRGDHPTSRRNERQYGQPQLHLWRCGYSDAEHHAADNRSCIGLEEVGAHARHIADIIADIVGDDCGVSVIVFWYADFDLAHKVGSHIGGLCVDATAHPRKERHHRSAERKPRYDRQYGSRKHPLCIRHKKKCPEHAANAQQHKADDGHAHHRTARKRNSKGR